MKYGNSGKYLPDNNGPKFQVVFPKPCVAVEYIRSGPKCLCHINYLTQILPASEDTLGNYLASEDLSSS